MYKIKKREIFKWLKEIGFIKEVIWMNIGSMLINMFFFGLYKDMVDLNIRLTMSLIICFIFNILLYYKFRVQYLPVIKMTEKEITMERRYPFLVERFSKYE